MKTPCFWSPIAIWAMGVLLCLPVVAAEMKAPPTPTQNKYEVAQALADNMRQGGRMPVIVGLDVDFRPMGELSPAEAAAQQAQIRSRQQQVLNALSGQRFSHVKRFQYTPRMALRVNEAALNGLARNPFVVSIQEDLLVAPTLDSSIPIVGADVAHTFGYTGDGQVIAILDTGVEKTHPFLDGKVVAEACFSTTDEESDSTSLCPGGASSSTDVDSGLNCTVLPGCDHGTHVAGIAAGASDTLTGVAPDASLVPIQVFSRFDDDAKNYCTDNGKATPCTLSWQSDQILALEHVYSLRDTYAIAAVNMSLGGSGSYGYCDTEAWKPAIDNLRSVGIATVVSSGNKGWGNAIGKPACISSAISVGSTTDVDEISNFSNVADILDLLAPGSGVTSSVPGGGYESKNGTSMSAPHVAGAWAVLKEKWSEASVGEILTLLSDTGTLVDDTRIGGSVTGMRRINIDIALDDNFEENDIWQEAWDYSPYAGTPIYALQADHDWYRISVLPDTKQLIIVASYEHSEGDINISLWDTVSPTPIAQSQLTTGVEYINYPSPAAGDYYVVVSGVNTGNTYWLNWDDVPVPPPDLAVDDPAYLPKSPSTGEPLTMATYVENIGGMGADATTMRYLLSADAVILPGDMELGTSAVRALADGERIAQIGYVEAPLVPGAYYLGVCVDGVAGESNTANNCSSGVSLSVTAAPDLIIPSITADDRTVFTDEPFTLTASVLNRGAATSGKTWLRYYLSDDSNIDWDSKELGADGVDGLLPGVDATEEYTGLASPKEDRFYLGACVEPVSGEANIYNNCSDALSMTVSERPALTVDQFTATRYIVAKSADTVDMDARVWNYGLGESDKTTLRYYLSGDAVIDPGDTELGKEAVPYLDPDTTFLDGDSFPPPSESGLFWGGACVEAVDGEVNTSDNCSASAEVFVASADCSGDEVLLANEIFKTDVVCIGLTSITTSSDVVVSGAVDVSFVAPLIELGPGFTVEAGPTFRVVVDYPKVSLP